MCAITTWVSSVGARSLAGVDKQSSGSAVSHWQVGVILSGTRPRFVLGQSCSIDFPKLDGYVSAGLVD